MSLEPERYELAAPLLHRFPVDRRAFFRLLGGSGFVAAAVLTGEAAHAQESGRRGRGGRAAPQEVGAWLHIAPDGTVTVFTGKAEVGQDIRTSLTQAVMDELPMAADRVRLVMGDTDLTPYDRGTFGSRTTPTMSPQLRRVAATARRWLIAQAARRWRLPPEGLEVAEGLVTDPTRVRKLGFGALTRGKRILDLVPEETAVLPPPEWVHSGRSMPKVDARDVVTGARQYTSDLRRPRLLVGKVLRPPRPGATLQDLGSDPLPGVTVVRDGDFAGVTARDAPSAERALAALRPTWAGGAEGAKDGAQKPKSGVDSRGLYAALRASARARPDDDDRDKGDVERALGKAAHRLSTAHEIAYIAHAPLEPRAAVAEWTREKGSERLTVWTGTQRPFGVRGELAQAFGLPESAVRVIAADTGSGYGGKHTGEAAIEAARLAKSARRPVKLVWTRQEEFAFAYFRPAGVIDLRSAISADGKLLAWDARNINSGGSGLSTPYEVPNRRHRFLPADAPLRQGSYRALAATANHFARESHMDELAALVKQDPLVFRERNLGDERLLAVLRAAADRFGWRGRKPKRGTGFGLACGYEKGGYVATCVELRAAAGADPDPKIQRVVTAFECGAIVNPDHLKNQVEGAVIMGLGGALFEAIDFSPEGQVTTTRFADYRVPRHGDIPPLETVLLDRKDLPPAGAGETPIVAIAPAIANALAVATGKRYRNLPLSRRAPGA